MCTYRNIDINTLTHIPIIYIYTCAQMYTDVCSCACGYIFLASSLPLSLCLNVHALRYINMCAYDICMRILRALHPDVRIHKHIYGQILYVYMHVYVGIHLSIYLSMCRSYVKHSICIYVCIPVHLYVHVYMYTNMNTNININSEQRGGHMNLFMDIYTCIHMQAS